jgi:DNA modification methylase
MAMLDNLTTQVNLAWDKAELESISDQVEGFDVGDFGFEIEDLPQVVMPTDKQGEGEGKPQTEVKEDDFDPDAHYETKVKAGEVWQLGEHRLMCGDSTDADAVAKLMNGERADLVFTDPPYGMKKESEGVLNDNLNFDDLLEFNKRWIPLTFANLKDNGSWYCWGIDEPLMDIYSNILRPMQKRNEITFRNLITWDKKHGQGQNSEGFRMYPIADEKCLFVMTGVQDFSTNADNYFEKWEPIRIYLKEQRDAMKWSNGDMKRMVGHSETSGCHWFDKSQWMFPTEEEYRTWQKYAEGKAFTRPYEDIRKEFDAIKAEEDKRRHEWQSTRAYFNNTHDNMNNVWHFDRTSAEEREGLDHATPKPLALCARGIKTSSRDGEIVLDVFGGSGSTMIACEQLGRKCRMMELDPHYCTIIIARWEKLTGQKAIKLNQ